MSHPSHRETVEESQVRCEEDRTLRDQLRRQKKLLELGKIITSEMNLDRLFKVIIDETTNIMNTERCSVFVFDPENDQLWSLVSTDLAKNEIRIRTSHGVAGWVFQHKRPLLINDAYGDPRFFPGIDKKTGQRTRNILCIPLINRAQECIGTIQTINKQTGGFTEEDRDLLTSASHYMAIALENAKLYEDLKVLDKAKERVINHLSHELKTPLAIISGVLSSMGKRMDQTGMTGWDKTIDRGRRNLRRLLDLQEKIDDILKQKPVNEKESICDIVQSAADLLWESKETRDGSVKAVMQVLSKRLESLFATDKFRPEDIALDGFLAELCEGARLAMGARELAIHVAIESGVALFTDRLLLKKLCEGCLKNAIENTPDGGRIEIAARRFGGEIEISIHDYGVGITTQNQQMIFGGFFHTQDTGLYSSRRPYEFNAGGAGSDLLRAKCLSERYGFSIDFESKRCRFIPEDTDLCPGKITRCGFVSNAHECASSGESTFRLRFPVKA
jgi:signal transduction histidine kinase